MVMELEKKVRLSCLLPFFLRLPLLILVVPLILEHYKGEGVAFEDWVDSNKRLDKDHGMG